jgi:hypothetical protein
MVIFAGKLPEMFKIISICKGGGYSYCRTEPKHPKANTKGLYPLHRVIMENKLGRLLLPSEQVHHKDENKFNNNEDNLIILSVSDHAKLHNKKAKPIELICSICGKTFYVRPNYYRVRVGRNHNHNISCSRSCATKQAHIDSMD